MNEHFIDNNWNDWKSLIKSISPIYNANSNKISEWITIFFENKLN